MAYDLDEDADRHTRGYRRRGFRGARPGFAHEKALIFGVVQLLAGLSSVVLAVFGIATRAWGFYYGSGFWGGGFFIAAGIFGLASARKKTNCTIVACMVLSAISAMLALVLLTLSAIGITSDTMLFHELMKHSDHTLVVHSLIIVIAVVEFVSGTASSIIGCRAVCGTWYGGAYDYNNRHQIHVQNDYVGVHVPLHTGYPSDHRQVLHPDLGGNMPTVVPGLPLDGQPMPFAGAQQIAIVAPMGMHGASTVNNASISTSESSNVYNVPGTYVMQSSNASTGFNQVMYVMPPGLSVLQPGQSPDLDEFRPPGTPPPSYSQLDLQTVGDEDGELQDGSVDDDSPTSQQSHDEPDANQDELTFEEARFNAITGARRTDSYRRARATDPPSVPGASRGHSLPQNRTSGNRRWGQSDRRRSSPPPQYSGMSGETQNGGDAPENRAQRNAARSQSLDSSHLPPPFVPCRYQPYPRAYPQWHPVPVSQEETPPAQQHPTSRRSSTPRGSVFQSLI